MKRSRTLLARVSGGSQDAVERGLQHAGHATCGARQSWRWLGPLVLAWGILAAERAPAAGTWTPLVQLAPGAVELMLLLPDGTVMAANNDDVTIGSAWFRLTPDAHGSYANGTWTTLASMHDTRLFYASAVLRDGRVFVAGGEYGTGSARAEVYDPLSNTWTTAPVPASLLDPTKRSPLFRTINQAFLDSVSKILPNGNVLVAPVAPNAVGGTLIYNPGANTWSAGPTLGGGVAYQDEASWVKLPDDSILTVDPFGTTSERYIPASNTWVSDSVVPVALYNSLGELGPAFLLPNGKVFYLGGTGHTALYTPSGTTSPGSWAAGPDIPGGLGANDAAGAMMANGKILCAVGSTNTFTAPTSFYEYDPVANAFTPTSGPTGATDSVAPYQTMMLDLPDGNVLYAHFGSQLYIYQPAGTPLAAGKPTINSISQNTNGSFHLTGTRLNGISEGAAYGDDAQMDSNYPLVRLSDGQGNVYYARTYNWSRTSVMTGSTPVTTEFVLPTGLPAAAYSLVAVANGISSDPVPFSTAVAPPVFTAISLRPDKNVLLSLSATANLAYRVDVSSNLASWVALTNLTNPTGTMQFSDLTATNSPHRFYRAVWVQ